MRRVAVTGLGVISALGSTTEEFWTGLREGRSGIRPLEAPGLGQLRFSKAAQVRDFREEDYFDPRRAGLMDRFAQFAVVAAREAVADAGLRWTSSLRENAAVITGSCVGGQSTEEQGFVDLYKNGRSGVHPLTIPRVMANAGASHISMDLGLTGIVYTVSTACSSGGHAIGQAFWLVRSGRAALAIAGGSEAPFSFGILKAWEAMRVVSQDTCRPFSRDRSGLILGEGAAMLVLEPLDEALARGARVHAEMVGFGASSDATHITQPSPDGAVRAMRAALADAAIDPREVGYINAHGTGTLANDATEASAIRALFGDRAGSIPVSSTKSMHGHALGASAALEAAATILALRDGVLPPTMNFTAPDPQCDLDVVPNRARQARVEVALSNSFAFGGLNAALLFRRHDGN
jgi:nodulation protein E